MIELSIIRDMGKALVIQGGSFAANAIYNGTYSYSNNSFTWGKGGINNPGTSSGSTNPTMSMVGLPLEHAEEELYFVGSNGYKIFALLTSDLPSPTLKQSTFVQFESPLDGITIDSGKYYQIAVTRIDEENADLSDGPSSLLLRQALQ